MPTRYKARTREKPVSYECLDFIEEHLNSKRPEILRFLQSLGDLMEEDDHDAFFERIKAALVEFALYAIAQPQRTPRQLIPTLKAIAKDPERFRSFPEIYDPEARESLLGCCLAMRPDTKEAVREFELGTGPGPRLEDIVTAADTVIARLERASAGRKRPKLVWQPALAVGLGRAFLNAGGKLTRNVGRNGGPETGPFHQFLELVLPAIGPVALRAGYSLSVRTIAKQAREGLLGDSKKN